MKNAINCSMLGSIHLSSNEWKNRRAQNDNLWIVHGRSWMGMDIMCALWMILHERRLHTFDFQFINWNKMQTARVLSKSHQRMEWTVLIWINERYFLRGLCSCDSFNSFVRLAAGLCVPSIWKLKLFQNVTKILQNTVRDNRFQS